MKTRWYVRQLALVFLFASISACSGNGCSCDGFTQQEFPAQKANKTIPTSGEVRITPSGFGFVEDNLDGIIGGAIGGGGGLDFCLPQNNSGSPKVCYLDEVCDDGSEGCQLSLSVDSADIEPTPPDTLNMNMVIGDLDETISVEVPGLLGDRDCLFTFHGRSDNSQPAQLGATIPITFTVDQATAFNDVRIEFGDLALDTSELDFNVEGRNFSDVALCEGLDFVSGLDLVRDILLPLLQDQFEPIIRDTIDQQLCVPCDGGCPGGSSCDADLNVCRYQDDTCPQNTLGIAGQLDLGTLLADFTETPDAAVDLTVRAADVATVNDGLTLGLRSGYDPVESSICVPADPTVRDFTAPPLSPTVTGNTRPGGAPFHFGLGYHKKAIESLLWSVWGSGATCMRVGSESIDLVSTGAFGALLPSIKDLTYGRTRAAYVKIVPQTEPKVTLGANTVMDDGNGSYTIEEPLMTVDWKDFDVHIYGFAQDRYTRLLTIRIDLALPIAVVADGMGGIVPVLGDFEAAIQNERILKAGLIAEQPDRILDLLPTLIGFALPALAGSLSQPIDIPEFFGFRINIGPGDITSVDNNTSVAIFADLELAGMTQTIRSETSILNSRVDLTRTTSSGLVRPEVTLDVSPVSSIALGGAEREVEYSYRVDGSTWSFFERRNQLAIDHPLLVVPGEHTIDVRSRYVGSPYTVDPTPATTKVVVDWEKPEVAIERSGRAVTFEATDVVDDVDELEYRYRIVTADAPGAWSAWTPRAGFQLTDKPAERFRIEVEARDTTGNVGTDSQTVTWTAALERESLPPTKTDSAATPAPRAGCNSAGGDGPAGLIWLLFAAGGLVLLGRRRRRDGRIRIEALGLAAILSVGACKCGEDPVESECDPECAAGEQCVDGECQATLECTTEDDCGDSEQCVGGECVPAPSCEELCDCGAAEYPKCGDDGACNCLPYCDKGCGDGEYCCYDSNSCETLPDPCAGMMCEPGFGPVAQSDPTADNETCELSGGECTCEKLPPLPLGWHGHYAAIDRNAGVTAIATYNSTYEDLMVGTIAAGGEITWYWVDGVPEEGDVEGALDGPRGGIADPGEDVGSHTALAIDDAGNLHVFYRDEENDSLEYAVGSANGGTYTFTTSEVDADGDTGYWSDAVHLDGTIHLVYATRAVDAGGSFETRLRHVSFDATGTPADPTATSEVLGSAPSANPCGFECERRARCVAPIGECHEPSDDCTEACADGTVCWQGTCEIEFTNPPTDYLQAVGTNAELTTTPDGGLLLVYWDAMQDSVVWQRWDGSWGAPNVVGAGTGPWASGAVDSDDALHLAYMQNNLSPPQLTYRNVTADVTETIRDGIRDTADWWLVNDIGEDVDLRIRSDGTPTVLFQDATAHTLQLATRDGADSWTISELAAPGEPYTGAHGFYATMLELPDAQFSVDAVIDQSLDPTEASPAIHE